MIEPVPDFAQDLRQNLLNSPSVQVIEAAVGPPGVESITLQIADGLTTAREDLFANYRQLAWARSSLTDRTIEVRCSTLDAILARSGLAPPLDVLSLDVEGYESHVLSGFSLERWMPRIMVIELTETHVDLTAVEGEHAQLYTTICDEGYVVAYKDAVNTVFVLRTIWDQAFLS